MDDIASYEPQSSEILEAEPGWATAFFEDELPTGGEAIAIGDEPFYAVARDRLGGRRVRLMFLDNREVETGLHVERTGRPAGLLLPEEETLDLSEQGLSPHTDEAGWFPIAWEPPDFEKLQGTFPAAELGLSGIDRIAPIAVGGTNLLIDRTSSREVFTHLSGRIRTYIQPERSIWAPVSEKGAPPWVDHRVRPDAAAHGRMSALRTAVAIGADLRGRHDPLFACLELPPVGRSVASETDHATSTGYGELVDLISSGLASTRSSAVTTVVRLPVPEAREGIASIVETLDVGDVECQIFVDSSGRFAPERSNSQAERDAEGRRERDRAMELFHRAEQARDKQRLLGERELTADEREAIESVSELRTDLSALASTP